MIVVSGLPMIAKIIVEIIIAGKANLEFIPIFCVLVAAIVVSEINDKLSPAIAPQIKAASISAGLIPTFSATPKTIGPNATTDPTDEPVAIDKNVEIKKIPGTKKFTGTIDKLKFTTESTAPLALVT